MTLAKEKVNKDAIESFEKDMAFVPKNYFFSSRKELKASMGRRMAFLKELDKSSSASGAFLLTDAFIADFLSRND